MSFLDYMQEYFAGEKAIGYYAVPVGIGLLILALAMWRFHWANPIAKGMFYPLLLLAVAAIGLGGVMYVKSQNDIDRLSASYQSQPQDTIREEVTRMAQVNGRWLWIKLFWAFLIVAGKGSAFFIKGDTWTGIGLGMLLIGAGGFLVDEFAERRAHIYASRLQQSAPGLAQ